MFNLLDLDTVSLCSVQINYLETLKNCVTLILVPLKDSVEVMCDSTYLFIEFNGEVVFEHAFSKVKDLPLINLTANLSGLLCNDLTEIYTALLTMLSGDTDEYID